MTTHTSGAADLPEALRIEDALNQADRAEAAALSYGEGTTLGIEAYAAAKTIRALHSRLHALAAGQAVAPATPLTDDVENLRRALKFYAECWHFIKSDGGSWDTVSGEPQNYWCDEAGTATVEDGSIAKLALAGQPIIFEDDGSTETRPAPPAMDGAWKDHNTAQLVNELRDVAVQFHGAKQLRERIAHVIVPLTDKLKAAMDGGDAAMEAHRKNGLAWAVHRWEDEVKHRPLQNVHRRSLDDAWRQVVRYFGGDPDALLGPCHDAARAAQKEGE